MDAGIGHQTTAPDDEAPPWLPSDPPPGFALPRVDVEFSLALHNRTGKFAIGRDLLADQAALIGDVYYWRVPLKRTPTGLGAKLISRSWFFEDKLRRHGLLAPLRGLRPSRPLLHLDPFTVLNTALSGDDIVLCHDLGPLTHRDLFAPDVSNLYERAYGMMAKVRPTVVFVSEASRRAYHAVVGEPGRNHVVYPPIRTARTAAALRPVDGIGGPFLLTVGSIGRRKNQLAIIGAFARSGLAERGVSYVLCGAREPGADEIEALARQTPGVTVLPYVTDAELAWLYAHAAGFVLMSRLEGFGIPVAEAIASGLVPLVTRGSVLEEVAGPAAIPADPLDEAEVAEGLRRLVAMDDGERRQRLAQLAAWIARFSEAQFRDGWRAVLEK